MDEAEQIVITGMGVVAPIGIGVEAFHRALADGKSGISVIEFPWHTGYKVLKAGQVKDFDWRLFLPAPPKIGRASQLAVAASKLALDDAGLDYPPRRPERVGAIVGTAMGDADEFETSWQEFHNNIGRNGSSRQWMRLGNLSERVAEIFDLEGPNHLVATTCSAGNHAIAWSAELLRSRAADAMLAVAADTIGFVDMLGFSRLLLQAPERCQPFDLHRKGTILSEGGAAMVLETLAAAKRRGANILAEVAGCGLSCDAAGPFASNLQNTRGMRVAAERAFRSAQMSPDQIDHVSAHGSATRLNDHKETLFLKEVLGRRAYKVLINSIKSMLGHTQGAASMMEAIACVLTLNRGLVYPTINYETPDPACDLDYVPNQAREQRVDAILSDSFGVGGNNALVIFRRWQG